MTPTAFTLPHLAKRLNLNRGTSSIGARHWGHTRVVPHCHMPSRLRQGTRCSAGSGGARYHQRRAPPKRWRARRLADPGCAAWGSRAAAWGFPNSLRRSQGLAAAAGDRPRQRGTGPAGCRRPPASHPDSPTCQNSLIIATARALWEKADLKAQSKTAANAHLPRLLASRSPQPKRALK